MSITTEDEAVVSNVQHKKPCHDCPWRRKAIAGWLGGETAQGWLAHAHGDGIVPCHTVKGKPQPQCVGVATYRANVAKSPRDATALRVKADREGVFARPDEFLSHHSDSGKRRT